MVGQYQSRSGVFGSGMAVKVRLYKSGRMVAGKSWRSRLGSVCSGASGYGKSCFGGAAQGGHVMVRVRRG